MKTARFMIATALFALVPATPGFAQTNDDRAAAGAQEDEAAEDEAIIVTGTFLDDGSKSAMKMDVPVLDTPFSVSSYSNEFVKSLETQSVADLYNYMTGLKKSGGTAYDITLRGFKSSGDDRNSIMVDGLPGLTGRYGSPPTIGVERIELVKGPMSVLYGQIQPGGFVNIITKKPQAQAATTIELRGNTWLSKNRHAFDHFGLTGSIDSTGALAGDGALMYRLVAQYGDNDGFRDFANQKQTFVAPSLTWEIGPDTTLTVQGEYRRTREKFDNGLAAPFDGLTSATSTIYDIDAVAPITTTYQSPDDFRVEEGKALSAYFKHDFGNWALNVSGRHVDYSSHQQEFSSVNVARIAGEFRVTRRARELKTDRKYDYVDINLNGEFETFGLEHKLLVGVNLGRDQVGEDRLKFFNSSNRNATTGVCPAGGTCLDISLYNPDFSLFPDFDSLPAVNPALANQQSLLTNRIIKSSNWGVYLSDLITITDWLKVSASVRKFREKAVVRPDARNAPNTINTRITKRDFLPSFGVLIQPKDNVTIYGSYAESFVPADPGIFDINGQNNFAPLEGKQYEFGIKTEDLLDGRLNATAAIYRIDQIGQITQFQCPLGSCSAQIGKARSEGFEIEGNYEPIDNWQFIFGYTHINARVLTSIPSQAFQVGRPLANVAKDAANLWTRYDWENGFGVGLGVTYTGPRQGILPTDANDLKPLDLPSYLLVDAGIYYKAERFSVNLKLGNIFDKRYFESSGAGSSGRVQIQAGQPRYATLTTRFTF